MTPEQMAAGRAIGASLGGKALIAKPAPDDCEWCKAHGYTSWHQHLGHLGFKSYRGGYMDKANRPSLRYKIKMTGRKR